MCLLSVAEIEAAIKTLPKEELVPFNQWYQEFLDEAWDEQIRQDVRAGKLDLLEEVQREREGGRLIRTLFQGSSC